MREIKFRAIDKLTGNIIDWDKLMIDDIGIWMKSKNGTHSTLLIDAELIQYTGLKDKNDAEIYEGDLLSGHAHKVFKIKITSYGVLGDSTDEAYGNWNITSWIDEMEVIGNIYKNEELLK